MSNLLIGLAGDSGAGKSSFLNLFLNLGKDNVLIVEGDAYHKWERGNKNWEKFTHLDPKANRLDLSFKDMKSLKDGKSISFREYNHSTGKFDPEKTLDPKKIIVYAGLHSLYTSDLRSIEDIKIYLNTDENLRLFWKYKRDINERGCTKSDVDEFLRRRMRDSKIYIQPQMYYADIIVNIFDDRLDVGNFDYVPKLTVNMYINKNISHLKDILHILKNINFRIEEDEKFIKAFFDDKIEQISTLS